MPHMIEKAAATAVQLMPAETAELSQSRTTAARRHSRCHCVRSATRSCGTESGSAQPGAVPDESVPPKRSEEHTSELQSLMRISYAVFCLKKKKTENKT